MQYNNIMEKIVYILQQCTCHYTIINHRVRDILKMFIINRISQSSSINVQSLAGIALMVLTRSSYAVLGK